MGAGAALAALGASPVSTKAANTTIKGFTLYVVGEGIEKKKEDFAAEVAAVTKG